MWLRGEAQAHTQLALRLFLLASVPCRLLTSEQKASVVAQGTAMAAGRHRER